MDRRRPVAATAVLPASGARAADIDPDTPGLAACRGHALTVRVAAGLKPVGLRSVAQPVAVSPHGDDGDLVNDSTPVGTAAFAFDELRQWAPPLRPEFLR